MYKYFINHLRNVAALHEKYEQGEGEAYTLREAAEIISNCTRQIELLEEIIENMSQPYYSFGAGPASEGIIKICKVCGQGVHQDIGKV
jgi:hypothetical protein